MPLITACLCLRCLCIWCHVLRARITCITNYLCLSSLYSIDCISEDLSVSCLLFLYQKHTDKLRYPTHFRKKLLWVNKNRYSLDPPRERLHYFFFWIFIEIFSIRVNPPAHSTLAYDFNNFLTRLLAWNIECRGARSSRCIHLECARLREFARGVKNNSCRPTAAKGWKWWSKPESKASGMLLTRLYLQLCRMWNAILVASACAASKIRNSPTSKRNTGKRDTSNVKGCVQPFEFICWHL